MSDDTAVLVVGASQGLGLELVRQYAAEGRRVIATVRGAGEALPAGVRVLRAEVTDDASVAALADSVARERLSLVVISAGAIGPRNEAFEAPPEADFDTVMHTNVRGPMALIAALAPAVRATRGTIAVLTSRMGSIADASSAFALLYRCSKAAANMAVKCAASEYGPQGVRVIALHPGWVRTAMGGPEAPLEAPEAVSGLRRVIGDAEAFPGGGFYNYQGESLPW